MINMHAFVQMSRRETRLDGLIQTRRGHSEYRLKIFLLLISFCVFFYFFLFTFPTNQSKVIVRMINDRSIDLSKFLFPFGETIEPSNSADSILHTRNISRKVLACPVVLDEASDCRVEPRPRKRWQRKKKEKKKRHKREPPTATLRHLSPRIDRFFYFFFLF